MFGVLRFSAILTAATLALTGCASQPEPRDSQVGVQMFMWNWNSIASECKEAIGPAGIDWVLVSPPQEHIQGTAWWIHYQPVSYQLESALGTREEFAQMVKSCSEAGVDVYADAVINHMSAQGSGTGFAGTEFTKYDYPELYAADDFHSCDLTSDGQIADYTDKAQVQTCELLGLADLNTSLPNVQSQILGYLNDLIGLGVKGFRIDAAKHIAAEDLLSITKQLPEGIRVLQEVIRGGGEPIQPEDYLDSGDVWEFDYARAMRTIFQDEYVYYANNEERFSFFSPSDKTISFVSNHDTERNGQTLNYTTAKDFELATLFMLAEDYGQPMLLSSFAYSGFDDAPPSENGLISNASCPSEIGPLQEYEPGSWICQHRWPQTVAMIKFRETTSGSRTQELVSQQNVIAIERVGKGVFAVNVTGEPVELKGLQVDLPDGTYCQVLAGPDCSETISVANGELDLTLAGKSAIAIHAGAKK